jgi:hypothetical protein
VGGASSSGASGAPSNGGGSAGVGSATGGSSNASGGTFIGTGGATAPPPPPGKGVSTLTQCKDRSLVGPSRVRRLSRLEYINAVRDLFAVDVNAGDLPSDDLLGGVFVANTVNPMTADQFTRYTTLGQTVADTVVAKLTAASSCADGDATCIKGYLTGVARRAFHGVLETEDKKRIEDLYSAVAIDDAKLGASTAVRFILESPRFLYTVVFGTPNGNSAQLSAGELAGRLASFLWRSVPDAELLTAADGGGLADAAGVRAQATRMLQSGKAQPALRAFIKEWLGLSASSAAPTSVDLSIDAEAGDVFTALVQGSGTYTDLLKSRTTRGSADLASFYGSTVAGDGTIALPLERQGLLLRAAFMRSHIKGTLGSPTLRGKQVRLALLCDPIPPPGKDVNMNVPAPTNGQTAQDVFTLHAQEPKCAFCHSRMDPIGFGFGAYGADGAYNPALTKSSAGSIEAGFSNPYTATFADTSGLVDALASGDAPQQCFELQTFRFALGRGETDADACGLSDVWTAFQSSKLSLQSLFLEVATSTLMRTRNVVKPGEICQ